MAVNVLNRVFRRISLAKTDVRFKCCSTEISKPSLQITTAILQNDKLTKQSIEHQILFTPWSVNLNFNVPKNEMPVNNIIKSPFLPKFHIDDPSSNTFEINDVTDKKKIIEIPNDTNIIEKQAVRMIVIRRKKMKKHKRRKFLKRMKYVIMKKEKRKKLMKEKLFEAELQVILQKAETFDAKQYVDSRIHLLTRERTPTRYMGKLLPEEMVKEFLKEQKDVAEDKKRKRTYRLKVDE